MSTCFCTKSEKKKNQEEEHGRCAGMAQEIVKCPKLKKWPYHGSGLSPWRPGFDPSSVHVRFVLQKVTLRQTFLQVLLWQCHSTNAVHLRFMHLTPLLHDFTSLERCSIQHMSLTIPIYSDMIFYRGYFVMLFICDTQMYV